MKRFVCILLVIVLMSIIAYGCNDKIVAKNEYNKLCEFTRTLCECENLDFEEKDIEKYMVSYEIIVCNEDDVYFNILTQLVESYVAMIMSDSTTYRQLIEYVEGTKDSSISTESYLTNYLSYLASFEVFCYFYYPNEVEEYNITIGMNDEDIIERAEEYLEQYSIESN